MTKEKKIKEEEEEEKKEENNDNNRDEKEETTSAWTNISIPALYLRCRLGLLHIVTSKKKSKWQQQQQQKVKSHSLYLDTSAVAARAATESV